MIVITDRPEAKHMEWEELKGRGGSGLSLIPTKIYDSLIYMALPL